MEKQIKMAARLYQCRDTAKKLFKDEYQQKLKWYKELIEAYQKENKLDVLESMISLCKSKAINDNGMAQMLLIAAAVEIIEPSA